MRDAAWRPRARAFALERVISIRHLRWLQVDWQILLVALGLLSIGLAFVHAMDLSDETWDRNKVDFGRHVKTVCCTLPFLLFGLFLRPRWLRRNAWMIYACTLVLLLAVLVPWIGAERNNARRWISLPIGFDLQPSELAKLGLIAMLASALYKSHLERAKDWLQPLLCAGATMALVAVQPDLGTAMTIVPVVLGMLYLAGARAKSLFWMVAAGVLAGVMAWQIGFLHDYQLQRIETWLETWDAPALIQGRNGPAFHAYQARVAIGNGGWLGTGLGAGVANEAAHLPERSCDSIFAVIAEEAGFVGTSGFVILYALLIVLLFNTASHIRERFSRLVVGGIALYFAAHFFINAGVNLGLVPMTGLTLPLLSTGGSSLATSFLALGLALGLSANQEPSLDQDAFRG